MDPRHFTDQANGQLIKIQYPIDDWAFLPKALPTDWAISGGLWPLISEAKLQLGRLDGKASQLLNPELLLHPLQSREAITSSQLEGTYVAPEQLLLYEMAPDEAKAPTEREAEDWKEVANYTLALRHGFSAIADRGFTLGVIKEMHRLLMDGARGADKSPGQFRRVQAKIGHDGRFVPPPPEHVSALMENLETYLNADDESCDPLARCYIAHYQFEAIHPLEDGNGRVGRTLLALMIGERMKLKRPWLYMSAFFERYKDEYAGLLFKVSSEGRWEDWIQFCIRGTIEQARDAILRCDLLSELRNDFQQRLARLPKLSGRVAQLAESLFAAPLVHAPGLSKRTGVHYLTARADIEKLVRAGILQELGHARPKTYYSPEIFKIAYSSPEKILQISAEGMKDVRS